MGKETLKYSPAYDVSKSALIDTVEEHVVRCYPYIMPNLTKTKAMVQSGTLSIIYVSQDMYKNKNLEEDLDLKLDDNGNYYFEIAAFVSKTGQLDIVSSTSTYGLIYEEETNFTALTDDYRDMFKEEGKIFTIGAPLDVDKYNKGEQNVYLASKIYASEPEMIEELKGYTQTDSLTEISFVNIKVIESMYSVARIQFTTQDTLPLMENPGGISVEVSNTGLINFIRGKAFSDIDDEAIIDIEVISDESKGNKITPWKFTPVGLEDKLTMYNDWADNQMVMFKTITDLFKDTNGNYTNKPLTDIVTDLGARQLIEDCLTISLLFATQFTIAPKILKADIGQGADKYDNTQLGKYKPETMVGHEGLYINSVTDKTASSIINGLIEAYIR